MVRLVRIAYERRVSCAIEFSTITIQTGLRRLVQQSRLPLLLSADMKTYYYP